MHWHGGARFFYSIKKTTTTERPEKEAVSSKWWGKKKREIKLQSDVNIAPLERFAVHLVSRLSSQQTIAIPKLWLWYNTTLNIFILLQKLYNGNVCNPSSLSSTSEMSHWRPGWPVKTSKPLQQLSKAPCKGDSLWTRGLHKNLEPWECCFHGLEISINPQY